MSWDHSDLHKQLYDEYIKGEIDPSLGERRVAIALNNLRRISCILCNKTEWYSGDQAPLAGQYYYDHGWRSMLPASGGSQSACPDCISRLPINKKDQTNETCALKDTP